jgi:hypothetical protein
MVIQSTRVVPSGPDQADAAPNVSRQDPTSTVQFDAEHLARNRKLAGPSLSSYRPGSLLLRMRSGFSLKPCRA